MFVVLYEFQVTPGAEKRFEALWHRSTNLIADERGSGGSRLHKCGPGEYVAYAVWPSREQWQATPPSSEALEATIGAMRGCCSRVGVLREMTVVDDLVRALP